MSWRSAVQRLLAPIVEVRREEVGSALLMFFYSFLAMTAYDIVKPLTRAQVIGELGAVELPWVLLLSGVFVGVVMQVYTWVASRLPPRAVIAATQVGVAALLIGFWAAFRVGVAGTAVAFYLVGQILGLLLISQFWVLANDVYDARQAERLFGFIGGGASLGGVAASAVVFLAVCEVGADNLLLASSVLLLACAGVVTTVLRRAGEPPLAGVAATGGKKGVGGAEALRMLRGSRHLQLIALIIGFAAIGAGLLDQQLNMAVEETEGAGGTDRIAAFLGKVQLYLSLFRLILQVGLTSRIIRSWGIGSLLILPICFGSTGGLILATGALWAAVVGRVLDSSLRYSVDKTTREVLFNPLPKDCLHHKPFIDVTVDRFAKGLGAVLTLVLIQPWGFGLAWRQLSWVSLVVTTFWVAGAVRARPQYLASLRQRPETDDPPVQKELDPERFSEPYRGLVDLPAVESLVEELGHPDPQNVLNAIDTLVKLKKSNLVIPLLLRHESAAVRTRALGALGAARPDIAVRWTSAVERLVTDPEPEVRMVAVQALAAIRNEDAVAVSRTLVDDPDLRIVATAAVVLSDSDDADDQRAAKRVFAELTADMREGAGAARRDLAAAIRGVGRGQSYDLLAKLLQDPDPAVADEAMRTIRHLDMTNLDFAPVLISYLSDRRLKGAARETLIRYGEPIVDKLRQALDDPGQHVWVRRHIPATLAHIPCQASMDVVMATLDTGDGFLRFKALSAGERLRHKQPALEPDLASVERLAQAEGRIYFRRLDQHYTLFERAVLPAGTVLAQALRERIDRAVDRIYRLLSLILGRREVDWVRPAIERGEPSARASTLVYLKNKLSRPLRDALLPVLEPLPMDEKIERARIVLAIGTRDAEETLATLVDDEAPVVAVAAIHLIGERKVRTLCNQVKRVLAARGAAEAGIAEAAAWTLARLAPPSERSESAANGLPASAVVDRIRKLPVSAVVDRIRKLPLFAAVEIDELFRIARAGRQARRDAGATVLREGSRPEKAHLLLDGEMIAARREAEARRIAPPAAIGLVEALAGGRAADTVYTAGPAVLLTFGDGDLRTLLSDSAGLAQGLFRMVAEAANMPDGAFRSNAPADLGAFAGQLTDAQKGFALRWIPLFSRVTGVEMLHLSAIARQKKIKPETSFTEQTAPAGIALVLSGAFGLRTDDDDRRMLVDAAPGDIIGQRSFAGLDDSTWSKRLVTTGAGSILWIERDDFFELLGHRPRLLQQIFATWKESSPMKHGPLTAAIPP